MQISELAPSKLGTKTHWDDTYTRELDNYAENPEDEGTVWFDEASAEEKLLEFLEDLQLGTSLRDLSISNVENPDLKILDLGTGNGHMLFALQDEGWKAQMIGVDYSEKSVELANRILERRRHDQAAEAPDGEGSGTVTSSDLRFLVWDILKQDAAPWLQNGFDIILDKGTFDAISLNHEADEQSRTPAQLYIDRVPRLLKPGGVLLITSCNWTQDELRHLFATLDLEFSIPFEYPTFTFGGAKGHMVSTVCLKNTA
ncbi:MAG: hypothetical protein M1828_005917 [Chrysothrix sp. TS-e1954]|nr:MAG: hypothetical protein M1828_005917 [Chrysothrix sp. TS-e1954]